MTSNYLKISPSLIDKACADPTYAQIEEEGFGISWTVILGIVITCLILLGIGVYVWWFKYIKNRRKNLVIPKGIVMLRARPSAIYAQISMHCSVNISEHLPI